MHKVMLSDETAEKIYFFSYHGLSSDSIIYIVKITPEVFRDKYQKVYDDAKYAAMHAASLARGEI